MNMAKRHRNETGKEWSEPPKTFDEMRNVQFTSINNKPNISVGDVIQIEFDDLYLIINGPPIGNKDVYCKALDNLSFLGQQLIEIAKKNRISL